MHFLYTGSIRVTWLRRLSGFFVPQWTRGPWSDSCCITASVIVIIVASRSVGNLLAETNHQTQPVRERVCDATSTSCADINVLIESYLFQESIFKIGISALRIQKLAGRPAGFSDGP